MPKFKDKELANQKSTSGIIASVGEISANDNDSISYSALMKDYDNMRKGDPIISGQLEFLKLPILQTSYRIDYDEESEIETEINNYLQWTFDNLYDGFQSLKYHSLLALDYGNSIFEYVWKYGVQWNGRTVNQLQALSPIQNYNIYEYLWNDQLRLVGLKLYRYDKNGSNSIIEIPASKLFIHTHNEEYGDIRGRSILRPMRKYWNYKQALIDAGTRITQKGGIAHVEHFGSDDTVRSNARVVAQSLGNMKNAYVTSEMDKLKINILDMKGQENLMPLLEYMDKQTFYGTLSQFMMSGIGQNGSRSATSEHKSSYELMANYVLKEFEDRINYVLIPKILQNSPFAYIDVSNIPYFRFNSISSIDIQKVAPNLINLYNTNLITKTPDDEVFIREMFGLPEVESDEIKVVNEIPESFESQPETKKLTAKRELNEFEKSVFNLDSAIEHFETTQEKTEKLLQFFTRKIFDDLIDRFKKGEKSPTPRYQSELISKLKKIYDEGSRRGFRDVQVEIQKLEKKTDLSMKEFSGNKEVDSFLLRAVKKLYSDIQFTFEDELDYNKTNLADNKENVDDFFTGIEESFKGRKRDIVSKVQGSYNQGRKEALKEYPVISFEYNAILDDKVCDNCSPLDQKIIKADELIRYGVSLDSPVNSKCEGRSKCRCMLIPHELGGSNE